MSQTRQTLCNQMFATKILTDYFSGKWWKNDIFKCTTKLVW